MINRQTTFDRYKDMKYNDIILKNGEQYGFKTANLIYLDPELKNYPAYHNLISHSQLNVGIPVFSPISHAEIVNHLDKYAINWRHVWEAFVTAFNNQEYKQVITDATAVHLRELQQMIIECFNNHLFGEISQLQNKINANDLLMVRSTGKEDSTELANPGGNESKDCVKFDNQEISKAIGEVIASYMGIKSLSQRLKSGKDDITKFPFVPVLVQKMIKGAYSGVMYSGSGSTRIQVAPGHGELIVNSKGNFDNYYITPGNMVYAETSVKHFRLEPKYNNETKKTELVRIDNEPTLKYAPSLSEDAALYLHQLAQFIEAKYNMRMDIEFIYDPNAQFIHIVQARAIPLGERKNLIPSAASIEFITEITNNNGVIINGTVITPEVNRAAVITSPSSVIICDTVDEALAQYLKSKNPVNAVIVKQYAPDTSHEAGEFSSKAIPVIQVDELETVQNLLAKVNANNPIIIDPQRKKVLMFNDALPQPEIGDDVENFLYNSGKLKEGIFKSTLTHYVTPYKYDFEGASYQIHYDVVSEIKAKKLGTFLHKVRANDPEATDKLLSFLFQIIKNKPSDIVTDSYTALLQNLDKLAIPKFGSDNQENKNILSSILHLLAKLRQRKLLSQEVFTQSMLIGGELYILLENLERMEYDDEQMIQYLNVLEKFSGSIIADTKRDILADSVFLNAAEKQHEAAMLKLIANLDFSHDQQQYFFEVTKLGRFLINPEAKQHWYNFCVELCKDKQNAAKLGNMVGNLVKKDLHESWINVSFVTTLQKNNNDYQQTFIELQKDLSIALKKAAALQPVYQLIHSLEAQISSWREPDNFPKLYPEFIKTLDSITKELQYDSNAPMLVKMIVLKYAEHLVDILDKTIKSLEKSTIYTDKALQVERFYLLLNPFYSLMKQWVSYCSFPDANDVFQALDEFLFLKKYSNNANELSPSGNVSVSSCVIGQPGEFLRNFIKRPGKTLEDSFTLIHQNLVQSIATLAIEYNSIFLKKVPSLLENIITKIETLHKGASTHTSTVPPPSLVSVANQYPIVTLSYNIPLRLHSGILKVAYNYIKNNATVDLMMFAINSLNHWQCVSLISYILALANDVKIIVPPRYNNQNLQFKFSMELEDNPLSIQAMREIINNIMRLSFFEVLSDPSHIDREVVELIKKLENIEKPERLLQPIIEYLKPDPKYCQEEIVVPILTTLYNRLDEFANLPRKELLIKAVMQVINLYDDKAFSIYTELVKLEESTLLRLIHPNILLGFKNNYFTSLSLLTDIRPEEAIRQGRNTSTEVYGVGGITFERLKNLDTELLSSRDAVETYKIGIDANTLLQFPIETFNVLTSSKARLAYSLGLEINSLKDSSIEEINLLLSHYIINCYSKINIAKEDLKNLEPSLIDAICSEDMLQVLKTGLVSFNDLKTYEPKKIKNLHFRSTIYLLENHQTTMEDLTNLNSDVIDKLTSTKMLLAYDNRYITFKEAALLSEGQLQFFFSNELISIYYNCKTTFNQIKDLDRATLKLFTSKIAKKAFALEAGSMDDLKQLDRKVLQLILSQEFADIYPLGMKFSDFKGLNVPKAKMKIAVILTNHYSVGSNITVSDIEDMDDLRYLFINPDEAIRAYKTGYVKFEDLKDLDENMILLLISYDAIKAYQTGQVTISMLKKLPYDAAEKLINEVKNQGQVNAISQKKPYTDSSNTLFGSPQIKSDVKVGTNTTTLQEEKQQQFSNRNSPKKPT